MQYRTYLNSFINLTIIIFFIFTTSSLSIENKIIVKVDNEIITNLDIEDEIRYLKALNPKIKELNKKRLELISKNSLIKEKVKKIEILKYTNDLELNKTFLEKLIRDRYSRLNLKSKKEFFNYLKNYDLDLDSIEKKISIEGLWNQLIYQKYFSKIKIDEKRLEKEVENFFNQKNKQYLLSEIVFNPSDKENLENKYSQIKNSILQDGFENTASTFSISESSKVGGKLGWISGNSLSESIIEKIRNLKKNQISELIFTPNGYIILKIDDIKFSETKFDKKKELNKLISIETNKQLNQYSNILFNKAKKNININEL